MYSTADAVTDYADSILHPKARDTWAREKPREPSPLSSEGFYLRIKLRHLYKSCSPPLDPQPPKPP